MYFKSVVFEGLSLMAILGYSVMCNRYRLPPNTFGHSPCCYYR